MAKYVLVIHGGAGTILRSQITAQQEAAYTSALEDALNAGFDKLRKGGSALDAVRAAIISMEDCILFNAGKGSVFTKDGKQEMDASIMDGKNLMAGAVSSVRSVRNPIELAYTIMTNSPHVMLNGTGALVFAQEQGLKIEADDYFFSQFRYDQWLEMQGKDAVALDHNINLKNRKFGTVGAVALDLSGNLAAGTSTGGMTNKQFGRVGDSPIIGAGTYANNQTCAISCTGHGEPFIRAVTAYDISCLMEYKKLSLQEAMHVVVHDKLIKLGGEGGMIGIDTTGNTAMVFNSEGMYRGLMNSEGVKQVLIYK
jgi:beta-aspartyl-peptidase (threonine type)